MTQSAKIERLRIGKYFSSVVISEAAACEKPDLRIFRRALDEIGSDAEVTWFVGDHPLNDILGAAAAGLVPVWLEGIPLGLRGIRSQRAESGCCRNSWAWSAVSPLARHNFAVEQLAAAGQRERYTDERR